MASRITTTMKKSFRGSSGKTGTKQWLSGGSGGAGDLSKWYGATRKLYLPGGLLSQNEIPNYLNGTLAGDYGYDPLGLGQNIAQVNKYREYELIHARWAMLGAAGGIIPEGLAANGADIKGGVWFETGKVLLDGDSLNYFAVPWTIIDNPLPLILVLGAQVALVGGAEKYRKEGAGPPGWAPGVGKFEPNVFGGLDGNNPGGPFDPLGLADDPDLFAELKVKEIKNGRLAMMSMLGFFIQALVTGEGPYANWSKHVADPFGYNLLTIVGSEERIPTL
eukprot:CAMPEP_0198237264 /NCGR_PEP_ID=MMETSP1446-20131203/3106_1 /TAXON_ID=1461542 ORGANISM="Unidentified sp, Strain CCMP2111" /NCGR_SAMPLE_ID=MMETSP1446 /ASSEMBLY_ACC=CAM_ASM_001112 /LENGTH=276 /DNA_ID=CAMNT_0043919357 /DNA_START=72 /DNA_END=902 /DNA_ORIENTATION=-